MQRRAVPPLACLSHSCAGLPDRAYRLVNQLDPQAREARELATFRNQQISAELYNFDIFLAAVWRVVPRLILCFVVATTGLIAYRRWGVQENIGADYRVQELRAIHQPGQTPQHLTYSPHLIQCSIQASAPALLTSQASDQGEQAQAEDAPSFDQLLASEQIGRGKALILGYHQRDPRQRSSINQWYPTGVGIMPTPAQRMEHV